MKEYPEHTRLYVYHNSWHEEGNVIIVRKKKKFEDAVILNQFASVLWKIVEQGEWTVGEFTDAVGKRLGRDKEEAKPLVHRFLEKMIKEGLITTEGVVLFLE